MPGVETIVLCDVVRLSKDTQRWEMLGVFHEFVLPSIPGPTEPFAAFIVIRHMQAPTTIRMSIAERHDDGSERELVYSERLVDGNARSYAFEYRCGFPPVHFNEAGEHVFIVALDGMQVGRKTFRVRKAQA